MFYKNEITAYDKTERRMTMTDKKDTEQKKTQSPENKNDVKPGEIKGKIDIHDKRERRDGPGGN